MNTTTGLNEKEVLNKAINLESGMFVVYGPINSGKSFSLASLIQAGKEHGGLKMVELVLSDAKTPPLDVERVIVERTYKMPLKNKNAQKIQKARALVLTTVGKILSDGVDVVFVEETDSPEIMQIAALLSTAGCLVFVSVHAIDNASIETVVDRFGRIASPLFNSDGTPNFLVDLRGGASHALIPNSPHMRNISYSFYDS